MTALLTVPVIGVDVFKCGDPKTEENTYMEGSGKKRCRRCKVGYVPSSKKVQQPKRSRFCAHCEAGNCGQAHFRDASDARCMRLAGEKVCACGSSEKPAYRSLYLDKGNLHYRTGPAVGRRG